jgi:hypothetical protein
MSGLPSMASVSSKDIPSVIRDHGLDASCARPEQASAQSAKTAAAMDCRVIYRALSARSAKRTAPSPRAGRFTLLCMFQGKMSAMAALFPEVSQRLVAAWPARLAGNPRTPHEGVTSGCLCARLTRFGFLWPFRTPENGLNHTGRRTKRGFSLQVCPTIRIHRTEREPIGLKQPISHERPWPKFSSSKTTTLSAKHCA